MTSFRPESDKGCTTTASCLLQDLQQHASWALLQMAQCMTLCYVLSHYHWKAIINDTCLTGSIHSNPWLS